MKSNQIFIADASSFTARSGHTAYILQAVHYDQFEHLKAEGIFCSKNVFEQYAGSGVYDCEFAYGGGIHNMKKVQNITF